MSQQTQYHFFFFFFGQFPKIFINNNNSIFFFFFLTQRWPMRNSFPSTHASGHHVIILLCNYLTSQSPTHIQTTSLLSYKLRAREAHVFRPRRWRQRLVAAVHHGRVGGFVRRFFVSDVLWNEEIWTKLENVAYFHEWR